MAAVHRIHYCSKHLSTFLCCIYEPLCNSINQSWAATETSQSVGLHVTLRVGFHVPLWIQEHPFIFLWWGLNSLWYTRLQSHAYREWRKLFKAPCPLYCRNHEKYPHFTIINYIYHFLLLCRPHKSAFLSSQAKKTQPLLPPSVCPDIFRFPIQLLTPPADAYRRTQHASHLSIPQFCWVFPICVCQKGFGWCIFSSSPMPCMHKKLLPKTHSFKIQFLNLFLLPVSKCVLTGDD